MMNKKIFTLLAGCLVLATVNAKILDTVRANLPEIGNPLRSATAEDYTRANARINASDENATVKGFNAEIIEALGHESLTAEKSRIEAMLKAQFSYADLSKNPKLAKFTVYGTEAFAVLAAAVLICQNAELERWVVSHPVEAAKTFGIEAEDFMSYLWNEHRRACYAVLGTAGVAALGFGGKAIYNRFAYKKAAALEAAKKEEVEKHSGNTVPLAKSPELPATRVEGVSSASAVESGPKNGGEASSDALHKSGSSW
ncbi:TPA: hypothetical protein DEO28_04005 [Candidatus Dependentiae bacterium]|nr:MAG: hypothetical protein UR14_C0006G0038 [candidate division TM6 bacterium GW2011_GWE2_31_21]KKP53539.1 MAG: hypothetical protein UR43_C0004G0080 [candidate division TM6 bacterium GW2011_GWF2_33_332]HBS48220.1 hypothetical protein [Candidatus Dependentiae bacterium]HBZ73646.1 hypothetical protein [Candidatus Dependentiae bacterium]